MESAPAQAEPTPPLPPFKKWVVREYCESLVVAVILALFIRTFVVQAFKIPTGSMENNLLVGDHLLVNKVVYSPSLGTFEDVLLGKRPIARGHVIVFKFPEEPTRDFIKRVVGLPGETVVLHNKQVYVNNQALSEDYVHFEEPPRNPQALVFRWDGDPLRDDWGPQEVPAGQLFVMGDNRDNSRDSRYWGFLPTDQVKGRALLVYWSYDARRGTPRSGRWGDGLRNTLAAFEATRWERLFHLIR